MDKTKIVESIIRDRFCTNQENSRLLKMGQKIVDGTITENNFYDEVRKMTKNVVSDKAIKSWQRLADYMYNAVYGENK